MKQMILIPVEIPQQHLIKTHLYSAVVSVKNDTAYVRSRQLNNHFLIITGLVHFSEQKADLCGAS